MPAQFKGIKYQIFPNPEQAVQIEQTFGCCRLVYNMGLELQSGLYASEMGRMSRVDLNNYCNRVWKKEYPFLPEVDKFALTNSLFALERAFTNFFEKRGDYPRFKSKKTSRKSYTTNATNGNICIIFPTVKGSNHGYIKLPKLGLVAACIYRRPDDDFIIKRATVSKSPTGKYYASVIFQWEIDVPAPVEPETIIGLDYSSGHFYVDSNGESADPPHFYRKAEKKLAREQRRLSKMVKGSKNYQMQKLVVARLHEKVANQRKDFAHKESRKITNSCDVACVEDLDLHGLSQSLHFGKATADNGFGMFRTFLKYKLEEQGKYYVVIDKWYPSTKTCHECGSYSKDVKLGMSVWVCPDCGSIILRDFNAALNIRDVGFQTLKEHRSA